ncbi:MAG: aminotransferase class V-fold PLP-dependent enzyme [Acidobacteriota bacterium]
MSGHRGLTRRRFMGFAGTTVGAFLFPLTAADRAFASAMRTVASGIQRLPQDDRQWADVQAAFNLRGRITMNTANLAPASAPARAALQALTDTVDADPSFQNRAQFSSARQVTRELLAELVGADATELALTRNTTESNNFVVQGLDLGPGDEVVVTEHNHPSNRASWKVRARRAGFSVVQVPVATPAPSPQRLLDDLQSVTTARTRVIAYSHVTNTGGCRYPVEEISAWAQRRGILTLVDGAQTCGVLDLDLHAMGCDFYTASAHKWPCSPREVGMMYVRKESQPLLWPSVVGLGYGESDARSRLESLGQRDDASLAAFGHAIRFLLEIGRSSIAARVVALTSFLKEELAKLPRVTLYTPMDPDFSAGVVTFHVDDVDFREAYRWLYEQRRIVCAPSGVEQGGIRLSPHIYTSLEECERALAAVHEIVSGSAAIG